MRAFTRIIWMLLVGYSHKNASPQMFDRVLSTPLKFASSVSYIVTYLVVSHHTHPLGIDYPDNF